MLEAHNAWRRRRGRPERTMQDVELLVAGEAREMRRGRDATLAESELDQLRLEIDKIAQNTSFNGRALLDGSASSQVPQSSRVMIFNGGIRIPS